MMDWEKMTNNYKIFKTIPSFCSIKEIKSSFCCLFSIKSEIEKIRKLKLMLFLRCLCLQGNIIQDWKVLLEIERINMDLPHGSLFARVLPLRI